MFLRLAAFKKALGNDKGSMDSQRGFLDELRKRHRPRHYGLQICLYASLLTPITAALDYHFHQLGAFYSDLVFLAGAVASGWATLRSQKREEFVWWPIYLMFWLAGIPSIYTSGGLYSPIGPLSLGILLVGGLALQDRFSKLTVMAFSWVNFLFWIGVTYLHDLTPYRNLPAAFLICKVTLLGVGASICVWAFVMSEESLAEEAFHQYEQGNEARNQLEHAAKLAELGNLVATTAHELAQPIQALSNSASLLNRVLIKEEIAIQQARTIATRIFEVSQRTVRMLQQFRDFARKEEVQSEAIEVGELIRNIQQLADYDLRNRNVDLEVRLGQRPIWVRGDFTRFQQVVLNLVNNARDAAVAGRAEGAERRPRVEVRVETFAQRARIQVQNSGPGIPLDIQAKLFQPYFTTKSRGKGTGLGLSICRQLVHQQQGTIFFSSEPGRTIFSVSFPLLSSATVPAGLRTEKMPRAATDERTRRLT